MTGGERRSRSMRSSGSACRSKQQLKTSALTRRFEELALQLKKLDESKRYENTEYFPGYRIEQSDFLNWKVKARHLLSLSCGKSSEHLLQFIETEKPTMYRTNYEELQLVGGVFLAAKEDFEGGYLTTVRNLVQAEVFEDELGQAAELLMAGYRAAAAVIAGVVLETTLRQLCTDRGIPIGKLDKMNADLAKEGAYNKLVQKRITASADIRNSAAHGHSDQFKDSDVSEMIAYIEGFLSEQMS